MTTGDSKFRAPPSRAEPRASVSCDARGEINNARGRHSPVASKLSDELRDYLANQPRLVLIGVNGTAHLFQHFSFFHDGLNSQGARHDLA